MMPWPPDLSRRVIVPELLDSANETEMAANLRDLRRINRWFGGKHGLEAVWREGMRILDVGAASGDYAEKWAGVVSFDLSERHLAMGKGERVAGDAFALPFPAGSFDVVMANLFLHHFEDEAVVRLLEGFVGVARRGVVINDLERHPLAWMFLPWTAWLFGWERITLHDGPVSVAAAFRAEELRELCERAGMKGVRVRRRWPWFRLSVVWMKDEVGGAGGDR